jgi:16S rRNA processing protein RimM
VRKPLEPDLPGEWTGVGEILTVHGIQGELRVLPLTDDPSRMEELTRVYCRNAKGTHVLHLQSVRYHRACAIMKFKEIPDRTAAEEYRGAWLWIPKSERRKLPPDRFYQDQLLDMEVLDEQDQSLGRIKEIIQTGANDVFVVKEVKGEWLLPALKSIVNKVDVEAGKMWVKLPPGLREGDRT